MIFHSRCCHYISCIKLLNCYKELAALYQTTTYCVCEWWGHSHEQSFLQCMESTYTRTKNTLVHIPEMTDLNLQEIFRTISNFAQGDADSLTLEHVPERVIIIGTHRDLETTSGMHNYSDGLLYLYVLQYFSGPLGFLMYL